MKQKWFFVLVMGLWFSPVQAQVTLLDTLESGGFARTLRLYVPAAYTPGAQWPLVIHLHSYASNAANNQAFTKYMPVADTGHFLVAYPEGAFDASSNRYWNVGLPSFPNNRNDVQFISDLIDTLHLRYAIDLNRVYVSGFSIGGFMSHTLATKLGHKVAAFLANGGTMYPPLFQALLPLDRAVPFMHIHGTADNVIAYNGGGGTFSHVHVDSLMNYWVTQAGCNPVPEVDTLPNISVNDNSWVIRHRFTGGTNGAACILYKIVNGPHVNWPGTVNGFANNMDFSASPTIWNFFRQYTLDQFVTGTKQTMQPETIQAVPNPARNFLELKSPAGPGSFEKVTLYSVMGQPVLEAAFTSRVNIQRLPPGIYRLVAQHRGCIYHTRFVKE